MSDPRPTRRVDLHIDRLVLHGIRWDAGDRERFRSGVEAELARLLTEQGLPPAGPAPDGRPALPVDLRGAHVLDSATQVARQVYAQVCDRVAGRTDEGTP